MSTGGHHSAPAESQAIQRPGSPGHVCPGGGWLLASGRAAWWAPRSLGSNIAPCGTQPNGHADSSAYRALLCQVTVLMMAVRIACCEQTLRCLHATACTCMTARPVQMWCTHCGSTTSSSTVRTSGRQMLATCKTASGSQTTGGSSQTLLGTSADKAVAALSVFTESCTAPLPMQPGWGVLAFCLAATVRDNSINASVACGLKTLLLQGGGHTQRCSCLLGATRHCPLPSAQSR